jgi:hypothetical protein
MARRPRFRHRMRSTWKAWPERTLNPWQGVIDALRLARCSQDILIPAGREPLASLSARIPTPSQQVVRSHGAIPEGAMAGGSPACRAGLAIPERVPAGGTYNGAPCYSYCVSLSI